MNEQPTSLTQSVRALEQSLQTHSRRLTLGDATSLTGGHQQDAKQALETLMQRYDCQLQVTDQGDLLYDFGSSLHRRGEKTWAERWEGIKDALWKAFVVGFKVCISVVLVTYFVVFLVLAILLLVGGTAAKASNDNDSDSDGDGFGGWIAFNLLMDVMRSIFLWEMYFGGPTYTPYSPPKPKEKKFILAVYDYVFGPQLQVRSLQDDLRELAAYIRRQQGLLTEPEVLALSGKEGPQSAQLFTSSLVQFEGEADVSEQGALIGRYRELSRMASQQGDAQVQWYWDEPEYDYPLTGNSSGRNTLITFLNGFNLLASGYIAFGLQGEGYELSTAMTIALGWFPFLFSLVFFALPLIRSLQLGRKKARRRREYARKQLLRLLFTSGKETFPQAELLAAAQKGGKDAPLSPAEAEKLLQEVAQEVEGELQVQDDGNLAWRFDRLQLTLREAARLRGQGGDKGLGQVVFDTRID